GLNGDESVLVEVHNIAVVQFLVVGQLQPDFAARAGRESLHALEQLLVVQQHAVFGELGEAIGSKLCPVANNFMNNHGTSEGLEEEVALGHRQRVRGF